MLSYQLYKDETWTPEVCLHTSTSLYIDMLLGSMTKLHRDLRVFLLHPEVGGW